MTNETTFVLAGGCYWCLDAVYRALRGVTEVVSGFTGGTLENPTYEQVGTGETGHAEAVKVTFDESVIPADAILDVFFTLHDPTQVDRQGDSIGPQYRSAVFYDGADQRATFMAAMERARQWWPEPIVTEVTPLTRFYPADDDTQDYFAKNPDSAFCQTVTLPKVAKARKVFAEYAL